MFNIGEGARLGDFGNHHLSEESSELEKNKFTDLLVNIYISEDVEQNVNGRKAK